MAYLIESDCDEEYPLSAMILSASASNMFWCLVLLFAVEEI